MAGCCGTCAGAGIAKGDSVMNRPLAAQILLIGAIACLIWSSVLIFHGGFDIALAGIRVRSNAISRPVVLTVVFAILFAIVFEDDRGTRFSSGVLKAAAWIGARLQLVAIFLALSVVVVGLQ